MNKSIIIPAFVIFGLSTIFNWEVLAGQGGSPKLIFPQFANGETNGIVNKTRFILRNNGPQRDTGSIGFLADDGSSLSVPVDGSQRTGVDFDISPWGTFEFETDGIGDLVTGTVLVHSDLGEDSRLEGSLVFEILGSKVSVDSSPSQGTNQVYVNRRSGENAGIAIFNPDETDAASLELHLSDSQGVIQASRFIELQPQERLVGFVDDDRLFGEFFAQAALSSPGRQQGASTFSGTLNVVSGFSGIDRNSVSVIGLLQDGATGALTAQATSSNANHLVRISNLQAGPSSNSPMSVEVPLSFDFEDPTGSINAGERYRVFFSLVLGDGFSRGLTTLSPSGLPPDERAGTLSPDLSIFGVNFTPGFSGTINLTIETDRGNISNTISATFQTGS